MSTKTDEYERVDLHDGFEQEGGEADDAYAREFAGSLLMPREDIKILSDLQMNDLEMALRFLVPRDAMQVRLTGNGRARRESQLLGAQFVGADAVFVAFAWAGREWDLPPGVVEVWLAATVVQVVGVVAIVSPPSVSESRRERSERLIRTWGQSGGAGRRGSHQLDPVAAGGGGEGAGLVPVFAAAFDLEAVLLEAGEGGVDLGADDGYVGAGRDDGVVLVHEVDLGAGGFEPGEAAVEGVRDLGEAEDREELDGALEIGGRNLDAGVLEHQNKSEINAAATTIAVDQVIASATVRLSSP
jgi:hypothetical protein